MLNALTLSPALCGALLRHGGPRQGIMGWVGRWIDKTRDGYASLVRRFVRFSVIALVLVAAAGVGIFGVGRVTPQSFLPTEDQGAFFVFAQLPDGASVARSRAVAVSWPCWPARTSPRIPPGPGCSP